MEPRGGRKEAKERAAEGRAALRVPAALAREVGMAFAPRADSLGARGVAGIRSVLPGGLPYNQELDRYNAEASGYRPSVVLDPGEDPAFLDDALSEIVGVTGGLKLGGGRAAPRMRLNLSRGSPPSTRSVPQVRGTLEGMARERRLNDADRLLADPGFVRMLEAQRRGR